MCEEEELKCIQYVMGVSAGFGGCGRCGLRSGCECG